MNRGTAPAKVVPSQFSPPKDSPAADPRRWWTKNGADCAKAIQATVDTLKQSQSPRIRQNLINQSIYGNRRLTATQAQARARLLSTQSSARNSFVSDNATAAAVDTATSKIGETKPRPYFLTSGGNYKQQRKAKELNKYVEGVFYEQKAYDLMPLQFRDCAIDGDGFIFVKVFAGKVRFEVVSSMELWCDDDDAQYGKPSDLYRDKMVRRDELIAAYPKHKEAIERAVPKGPVSSQQSTVELLRVVETWHLGALGDDGELHGGAHAVALVDGHGVMLVGPEPWKHEVFPFSKMPWCAPTTGAGFWGQSLVEQCAGDQIELNKELRLVQQSMHMAGVLKYFYKIGSKVVQEHINNEIGTGIAYAGDTPPQFFAPQPIHETFFTNPERIRERIFRRAGQSELSAQAKKPQGLNAGVALREFEDIESERHKTTQRQYDSAALMLAELTVMLSIDAAESGELEAVRVPNKQSFDTVDFKKTFRGLKRSEFTLHCYSVSRLPREPSARLQTIIEHVRAGIITIRQGRRLLDFPDLDAFETLANAQEEVIQKTLDAIVDDGEYAPPEPTDDLTLAKEMVLQYIQHFRTLELEDERMDMLRTYSLQVDELTMAALPAVTPAQPTPLATPNAPPTSDLLPTAPGAMAAAA